MIGPGWMPSRPRPLPRVRRLLWAYTPVYRRRRRRRPPSTATAREPVDLAECGAPLELPAARLLSRARPRHRALAADLHRWIAHRWTWLRPRTVPIVVALAGMFAVIGATRYLSSLARGAPGQIEAHGVITVYGNGEAAQDPRSRMLGELCSKLPRGRAVTVREGGQQTVVICH